MAQMKVQIVRQPAVADDQLGPRHTAIHDVGLQQAEEAPDLQVLDLNGGVENHLALCTSQPVTQLDIFYSGPSVRLVEAAVGKEHFAADRAASAPECTRLTTRSVMHETMHQVFVL